MFSLFGMKRVNMSALLDSAEALQPELVALRRWFHQHPELALHEYQTSAKIAEVLHGIDGLDIREGLAGGTGIVALFQGGKGPGKTVLLRADIDALPIEEQTGLPFASQNPGRMHACGHDGHITWLLGSAMLLSQLRDQFAGTVKFVFQPGEEGGGGGRKMVRESHVLENPTVDAVFAAHAWPTIDAGTIGINERYAFGNAGSFTITITGKGGHGSWPHQCVDPIAISYQIYGALQQIISRKIDATQPRVLTIGSVHAGPADKGTIIPDTCVMKGTIRAVKPEIMDEMLAQMRRLAQGIAEANRAIASVEGVYGMAVENDPAMVELCRASAARVLGEDKVFIIHEPNLGGEDFSEYTSRVPGAYFYVGIANDETRGKFGLHSPIFQLDERVLCRTAAVFAQVALDYLKG